MDLHPARPRTIPLASESVMRAFDNGTRMRRSSVGGNTPRRIRVVCAHLSRDPGGVRAEVALAHAALLVDDESHHTGFPVFHRPRDQGEAADHVAIDDVVVFPARSMFALARQHLEKVAVERLW